MARKEARIWFERLWATPSPVGLDARALSALLWPASALFAAGVAARDRFYASGLARTHAVARPVISIGGLEVGGVGKTPLALELALLAADAGERPALLSRGYGSEAGGEPRRVDLPLALDAASRFGDEPALLAERLGEAASVWVCPDRLRSAGAAMRAGATLLLLDDGFQHRRLARDADIVSLAAQAPFGNGLLLPRGPLREPIGALHRADRVVLAGADPPQLLELARRVRAQLAPEVTVHAWQATAALRAVSGEIPARGDSVLLLSGIAHPERLRESAARLGLTTHTHAVFPDHHRFRAEEIARLVAAADGRAVVTTAKDWMRLRALPLACERLSILELSIAWLPPSEAGEWREWLCGIAARKSASQG